MINFIGALVVVAFFLAPLALSAALRVPDGGQDELAVNIGATVLHALRLIDMSSKEAALLTGMQEGNWCRGVHGLGPLDLWKLARLPWRFQAVWLPLYTKALMGHWMAETRTEYKESIR